MASSKCCHTAADGGYAVGLSNSLHRTVIFDIAQVLEMSVRLDLIGLPNAAASISFVVCGQKERNIQVLTGMIEHRSCAGLSAL